MDDVIRHPIMWMDDDDSEVAERLLAQKLLGQLLHGDYPTTELCTSGLQDSSRLRCLLHYHFGPLLLDCNTYP